MGDYLAWTFFAAMGITELFHFVFPFLDGGGFSYFPGMASAAVLAAAAWWGMARLVRPGRRPTSGGAASPWPARGRSP
ncbi:hypothetical protein [Brevundimonas sp.]|uniref:hypothetical protein n=1 Tax=Brevundimonas sp. TaxID=1871086 RepID=UPI003F6EEF0C